MLPPRKPELPDTPEAAEYLKLLSDRFMKDPATETNLDRDAREKRIFELARILNIVPEIQYF